MSLLNSYAETSLMVFGHSGTGKKSLFDLHIKNNQEKEEAYSIRLKQHDNHAIGKQILKPFS